MVGMPADEREPTSDGRCEAEGLAIVDAEAEGAPSRRRPLNLAELRLGEGEGTRPCVLEACDDPCRARSWTASTASTASGSTATKAEAEEAEADEDAESDREPPSPCGAPEAAEAILPGGDAKLRVSSLVLLVVFCGCACQAPYELMNTRDRGCGPLISLVEHLFGILASLGAVRRGRRLPWRLHLSLAAASVSYTLLLNQALSSELPTLVLITLKNGNLVANMVLGMCFMRTRYSLGQYAAVLCITAGLVVTSVSGSQTGSGGAASWSALVGLVSLIGALLSRAATGLLQEVMCKAYDAPVQELLLYRCALGLPLVLAQWGSIKLHVGRWNGEEVAGLAWPTLWVLLAGNMALDYATKVCISKLIDRTSALTATMVLTFQRFVSFAISTTLLSQDRVSWQLQAGAVAVLLGTLLYTSVPGPPQLPAGKGKSE